MKRLLVVLVLVACGGQPGVPDAGVDPREAFLGTWHGSYTVTVVQNGQSSTSQAATDWQIVRSGVSTDRVSWSTTACRYEAKVTSDTSFVIDPVNCTPQTTDAGCTLSVSISNGTGTRSGTSLGVALTGTTLNQCPSGGPQNGTVTLRFDGAM